MKEKLNKFIQNLNNYFAIPFLVYFLLSTMNMHYSQSKYGFIINIILSFFVVGYLSYIVYKLAKQAVKNHQLLWSLVVSLVLLILSLVVIKTDVKISDILFIVGIIFFEIYSLFIIINSCLSTNPSVSRAVIFSLIFVILGYYTIYISSYGLENNTIFNSLVTIFSSIVGGGITLAGVAWTINNGLKTRKEDQLEVEKVKKLEFKPYFSAKRIIDTKRRINHIIDLYNGIDGYLIDYFYVTKLKKDEEIVAVEPIVCINSDHSNFMVKKVDFNNYSVNFSELINKNENFAFYNDKRLFIKKKNDELMFKVYVEDLIGNQYKYDFVFDYLNNYTDGPKGDIKYKYAVLKNVIEIKD